MDESSFNFPYVCFLAGSFVAALAFMSACPSGRRHFSAITSRFIEEQSVNLQRVDVYVEEGTVYLSGEVENREEQVQAGRIASQTQGVKRVINKLQVIP